MAFRSAARAERVSVTKEETVAKVAPKLVCPACREAGQKTEMEKYGSFQLFGCEACGLQFWEPREMPDAHWYERMYGGRDQELLQLEPGHRYFLADPLAPRGGALLDIGCGTGNFLAAARDKGYEVSGMELDRNATKFAKERLGLSRVFPLTVSEFAETKEAKQFNIVTFFEVLEHQAEPHAFLDSVRECLKPKGFIALSVPNRERWVTGPDVLDYPPNHFSRWNVATLKGFLISQGFEVLSVREQPASLGYTAQMINMALRTGIAQRTDGAEASFRDIMQMGAEQAAAFLTTKLTLRQRLMRALLRVKLAVCYPLAAAAWPYVRWRGLKGTYLYCLARLRD